MRAIPIDIDKVLKLIKQRDAVEKLRLINGNCGIFAIALRNLLRQGELYKFGPCAHVVLKLGDIYIDGTGKYSKQEITKDWGYWGSLRSANDEEDIERRTSHTLEIDEMEDIISRLNRGLGVSDFYNRGRGY